LVSRLGLPGKGPAIELSDNEWTVRQLASKLGLDKTTVSRWVREGRLRARMEKINGQKTWIIQATETEIEQIREQHR
ncbi:MAG: helix-turn-helix domain-containing protein, partial [Bradymonadaceae bacterium]